MLNKKIVVIYHGGCWDGFSGAWAAWKKFGNQAEYVGATDRFALPRRLKGKEIYLIDYTYEPDLIKELIKDNGRVTAIDHHITSESAVKLTQQYSFSLRHSGAVLAWHYFHPSCKVPKLLRYVEDSDLWKWKLPRAREILAFVDTFDMSFKTWNRLAKDLETAVGRKSYAEKGKFLRHYEERLMKTEFLPNAELVNFLGYKIFALNAPHHFVDDLGHIFSKKTRSFAIVWREGSGRIKVSLRSDGAVDVSKIAKKFRGGGHKRAAAFSFPVGQKFPWKLVR